MTSYFRPAVTLLLLMTIITGGFYPALVTLLAQSVFPAQANGSLIRDKQGQAIGSTQIGQGFSQARYFWGRPSATAPYPYNATASGGSNLGPTNPALRDAVAQRIQALQQLDLDNHAPVPVDLVTASASGLDPHISIAAANYQVKRVAEARQLPESKVRDLVDSHIEPRQWRVFGEARVNVLGLNLALDAAAQTARP
ncbi:potassium-transporting ATPase subunit KdpC [Methylomonas rosea]|uniref:Potassium-transporting ATPase KdpC subunit n=1 Tax=Methylomonas rosea TaxID=2952227 RepID=A0ABT1TP55_9GAMM|nr:potassium-transporting ATPase subunit KdpC [Methylomonas sp. WSC-7]MCQ8116561.1 potassium-transporting ATPase subunit KdpC [Methylomonas sp. WSC-7]